LEAVINLNGARDSMPGALLANAQQTGA